MVAAGSSERRVLIGAILFFVLIKTLWAVTPAYLMGSPRLGDDALVYLWASDGSILTPKADTPAVETIRDLASTPAADPSVQFQRDRVGLRITGISASPFYVFGGVLLNSGLSAAFTFAVMECLTASILAVGAAAFLSAVFSHRSAALALVMLALAILPRQGLHFLIPSVLSLGLALLSLGFILRGPAKWRLVTLALLVGVSVSVHTIGKAYAALLLAAAVLCPSIEQRKLVLNLKVLAAILSGVGLGLTADHLPGTLSPQTGVLPALDLTSIGANIRAFAEDLRKLLFSQPLLTALCGAGLAFTVARKTISGRQIGLLLLFFGVIAAASAIVLPGYPGELMARMLIPFVILAAGFAGEMLVQVFTQRSSYAIAGAAIVAATQAPVFVNEFFQNLNGRWRVYDEAALAKEVSRLTPGAPVVWLDADNALPAALMRGATAHPALPFAAAGKPDLLRRITSEQPIVFAAQPPERLNSLSIFGDTSLRKRFFGWSFADVSQIQFIRRDALIKDIHVRLSGQLTDLSAVGLDESGGRCDGVIEAIDTSGWARIRLPGCDYIRSVELRSNCSPSCSDLRVLGVSFDVPPSGDRNWPWAQGDVLVAATPRDPKYEMQAVSFSMRSLLTANQAQSLDGSLQEVELLSDRSNVIWFSARIASSGDGAQ